MKAIKLPNVQGFTLLLVVLLVISGIGITSVYIQKDVASREANENAVRLQMAETLIGIEARAWPELVEISNNLTRAAAALSTLGLNSTEARKVLADAYDNMSYVVDTLTVDDEGVIIAVHPTEYQGSEGTNISGQRHIATILQNKMPVMSEVFALVEGFVAAAMHIPVFDANGTFMGTVCATINIQQLIDDIATEELNGTSFQFFCIQSDGVEVYDTDEAQIGRNLFTDPAYANFTGMQNFIRDKVIAESEGHGTYSYTRTLASAEVVNKEAYWSSFGLHGAGWRLVVARAL